MQAAMLVLHQGLPRARAPALCGYMSSIIMIVTRDPHLSYEASSSPSPAKQGPFQRLACACSSATAGRPLVSTDCNVHGTEPGSMCACLRVHPGCLWRHRAEEDRVYSASWPGFLHGGLARALRRLGHCRLEDNGYTVSAPCSRNFVRVACDSAVPIGPSLVQEGYRDQNLKPQLPAGRSP